MEDTQGFVKKFSKNTKNKADAEKQLFQSLNEAQARLIISPDIFMNSDLIKIKEYTRFAIDPKDLKAYQKNLKALVKDDISSYLKSLQEGTKTSRKGETIGALATYVKEGTQFINAQETIPAAPPLPVNLLKNQKLKTSDGKILNVKTRDWGSDFQEVENTFKQASLDRSKLEDMRQKHMQLYEDAKKQENPDYTRITKMVTQDTIDYVNAISEDIIAKLGPAPTKFSLFSMGSMPRDESGFFTDLEIGIIIEENSPLTQMYFQKFGQILSDRLFVLGEHPEYGGKGLRLDEADNAPYHKQFALRYASEQQTLEQNRAFLKNSQEILSQKMKEKNISQKVIDDTLSLFDLEKGTVSINRIKKRLTTHGFTPQEVFKVEGELLKNDPYREGSRLFVASIDRFAEYLDPTLSAREKNIGESEKNLKAIADRKRKMVSESYNQLTSQPKYQTLTKEEKQEVTHLLQRYADQILDPLDEKEQRTVVDMRGLSRNMCHLMGDSAIFDQYLKKRQVYLDQKPADPKLAKMYITQREADSIEMLKSNIKQWERKKTSVTTGKMEEIFEVKRHLYRFLEQSMTAIGFSYDVGAQNSFEILELLTNRGIIGKEKSDDFKKCLMFAADLRLKEQKIMGKQGHEIPANLENYTKTVNALQKEYNETKSKYDLYTKYGAPIAEISPFIEKMSSITAELKTLEKQKPEQSDSILDPDTLKALETDILPTIKGLYESIKGFVNGNKKALL